MKTDDIILDCYSLAKEYGRHPNEFLNLPITEIDRHRAWTSKLIQRKQEAIAAAAASEEG